MKTKIYLVIALIFTAVISKAQTTAMDFIMDDCDGQMHNLYDELNQNKVVILEFFMTSCSPCINAGSKIEMMVNALNTEFAGYVNYYHFAFNNSYTCATISNWIASNGFNSVPFDSGAAQVAYYGGFGMPTVVVVAGSQHEVLFSNVGFSTNDTTLMGNVIRNYFTANPVGIFMVHQSAELLSVYPNPASSDALIKLSLNEPASVIVGVVDATGKNVADIDNKNLSSGNFEFTFRTASLPEGIYFLKAIINGKQHYSRFSVIK